MLRNIILLGALVANSSFAVDLIAHRGNACGKGENSLESVNAAWNVGADAVEVDVQMSADGVVFLYHDAEIGGKPIRSFQYSEIESKLGDAAPRVSALLKLPAPKGYYILDLKVADTSFGSAVATSIDESPFNQERIIFQSEDLALLSHLSGLLPKSRYHYLVRLKKKIPLIAKPNPELLIEILHGSNVSGVSLKGRSYLSENYLMPLKNSGFTVNVWTINDSSRASHYRDIGIDGIITDKLVEIRSHLGLDGTVIRGCGDVVPGASGQLAEFAVGLRLPGEPETRRHED